MLKTTYKIKKCTKNKIRFTVFSRVKQLDFGLQNWWSFELMSILAARLYKTWKSLWNWVVWLVKRIPNFLHLSLLYVVYLINPFLSIIKMFSVPLEQANSSHEISSCVTVLMRWNLFQDHSRILLKNNTFVELEKNSLMLTEGQSSHSEINDNYCDNDCNCDMIHWIDDTQASHHDVLNNSTFGKWVM